MTCLLRGVDRLLRGANAGDLPLEEPSVFDLVVNLKTAKALGLTVSQSVLVRADQGMNDTNSLRPKL